MSSFKVYKGDAASIGDLEAEFQGTQILAQRFHDLYPVAGFADDAERRRFFRKLLYDIIVDPDNAHDDCVVTYWDHQEVIVKAYMSGGSRVFEYEYPAGNKKQLQLIAMQDDPSTRKVHMIIPTGNVDLNSAYLQNAITNFTSAYHTDALAKQKFLLGLLLLKKCR
ncbi:hypothetical protein BH10PSE7_BH10PSE7_00480 [soil metagenome]